MTDFWRLILDLDRIPLDATNLRFGWERPFPPWVWALAIILPGLYAVWSYSGLAGRRFGRGLLAVARFGLLFGLIVLLAGPTLVLPRERVERDWVVALIDRSQSMQIEDVIDDSTGERVARDKQLQSRVETLRMTMQAIAQQHNIMWLGFDAGAYELELDEERRLDLGAPTGSRTALGPAIEQAVRRLAARPISGIVVLSDGRTTQPPSRATLRTLQAEAAPVFVSPLGATEPIGDVAIHTVDAPARAFVHDIVPVDVSLDRLGAGAASGGATVSLIDKRSGEILDQQRIEPGDERDSLTLVAQPEGAGERRWAVRIETDQPDLILQNNERELAIDLTDRPLRVLYIDGYPRWEYRWLKDLLSREKSVDLSAFLASADRDFAQEGDTPITRLPNSPEEFDPYDVILLGDVHEAYFSPIQLDMLRDHVTERGAGVLWMAGPRSNPFTYADSVLASLAPVRGSFAFPSMGEPVTMRPTSLARRLGVLRLVQGETDAWTYLEDPALGWTTFRWALRIDPEDLKPTAEPLATTSRPLAGGDRPTPMVIQMRYGAGRSVLVATDEIWRWRYGQGDYLPEQFWIQLIRFLGRDRLTRAGQPASLLVEPGRVQTGEMVVIDLELLDEALAERELREIAVEVENLSEGSLKELALVRSLDETDRYSTTFVSTEPGELNIRVVEPALARLDLGQSVSVYLPEDELQRPEADHELLSQLAEQTDGAVLDESGLRRLPELLPNRSVRTPMDVTEALWDTPFCFAVFALLLTLEWLGRKLIRLV